MTKNELFQEIFNNLNLSGIAYRDYLQGGRTFEKACLLRKYNERMHELLNENALVLGDRHRDDARALLVHYDSWMRKWDSLQEQMNPEPGDEFVFPNTDTFPRQAAQNFEEEYLRIARKIGE
ncbi:MAG TPA: hypothetical protein VK644_07790 [Chitinophagaceae bacterium]|nr:hypothetical protein [Chitinophagaceae bacterium]